MNKTTAALALIAVLAAPAAAAPYVRLIDPSSPHFIGGGYLDPKTPGASDGGTAVALLTHANEDGCGLPRLVCTDWAPLTAGALVNGGRLKFAFGPVFNVAPVLKSLALKALDATTADDSFANLKSSLGSVPITGPDATVSLGPTLVLSPQDAWKGYFRIFAGGELRFGRKAAP